MRQLFMSECRRFVPAALIFALAHMLVQLYAFRINYFFLERQRSEQILTLVFYAIAGVAFAVAQIGGYRQPNRWLWLLHRPMSRPAIFGAIGLSALATITFAVALPALLTVIGFDWLTARPIGMRHYAAVPYLVMVCSIAWSAGAVISLNPSRFAFLVIFIPYVFVLNEATACVSALAATAVAAVMAIVVYAQFKPDRRTPPTGSLAMLASAAPLVLGFYFVLYWSGSALFQIGMTAFGVHPLNQSVPPAGGFVEIQRAEPRPQVLMGLAASTDARAEHWRRQVALTDVGLIFPDIARGAVPNQLSNDGIASFKDSRNSIEYVFDHAAMRFKGIDGATGADRGWSGFGGTGSALPFPTIPKAMSGYIVARQQALTYDAASGRYLLRVSVPDGERLLFAPKKIGDLVYQLTNRRLIAYASDAAKPDAPYVQQFAVTWAHPINDAHRVSIAPLLDGTLVSATNLEPLLTPEDSIDQTVYFVDANGRQSTVAQRKLHRDYPVLFTHAAWLTSPLLHSLNAGTRLLFELSGGTDYDYAKNSMLFLPRPPMVWIAALLLMALSGTCAWIRQRSVRWTLACTLFGMPALATLFVLTTKRTKE